MRNLWEKDRKRLFRELYHQYMDEGYDSKEAKRMAKQDADEMMAEHEEFAFEVARKEERDDY